MANDPLPLDLTIIKGDDYANADGRAITFTDTLVNWPDLTGATVQLTLVASAGGSLTTITGTVSSPLTNKAIRFDLTATQTGAMIAGSGRYRYDVQATLASGHRITLARGSVNVLADYTP